MNWLKCIALSLVPIAASAQDSEAPNGWYNAGDVSLVCPSVGVLVDSGQRTDLSNGLVVSSDEDGILTLEFPIPEDCDNGGVFYVKTKLWATVIEPEVLEFVVLNRKISCTAIYRQDDVVVANCRLDAPFFPMDYSTSEFPRASGWPTMRGDLFFLTDLASALTTLGLARRECSPQDRQEFIERAPGAVNVHWMRRANCDELEIAE